MNTLRLNWFSIKVVEEYINHAIATTEMERGDEWVDEKPLTAHVVSMDDMCCHFFLRTCSDDSDVYARRCEITTYRT